MTTRPRNDRAWRRYGTALLVFGAVLVVATTTVVLVRTAVVSAVPAPDPRLHVPVDADRVARHLSGALRFRTIAGADGAANRAEFSRFHSPMHGSFARRSTGHRSCTNGRGRTEATLRSS